MSKVQKYKVGKSEWRFLGRNNYRGVLAYELCDPSGPSVVVYEQDLLKMGATPIEQDTPGCECKYVEHQVCDIYQGETGKDTPEFEETHTQIRFGSFRTDNEQRDYEHLIHKLNNLVEELNSQGRNQKLIIKHLQDKS